MRLTLRLNHAVVGERSMISNLIFIICLGWAVVSNATPSKTYYVDAIYGNDDYNGLSKVPNGSTIGPWRSVSKVNSFYFNPGDRILFRRGQQWNDGPLRPKNGGRPGGKIEIKAKVMEQPLRFGLTDISKHNSVYFGAYGKGSKPKIVCLGKRGIVLQHNHIIVENLHIDGGGNNMLHFDREEGNYFNVVRLVDITNCSGNAVRFDHGGANCWLDSLLIYNYKVNGIYLEGSPFNKLSHILVENCLVEKPQSVAREDAISCHRDREGNNIQGNIIIRNNTITRSGEDGIDVTSGTHILVQGNHIKYSYAGGIHVAKSRVNHVEIRGNFLSSNSAGKGIGDLTIKDCESVRVANNIICGNGHHTMYLKDIKSVQIWNNILAPDDRTGKLIWLSGNLDLVQFKNNIFDFTRSNQKIDGSIDSVTFDFNCYYLNTRAQKIIDSYSFAVLRSMKPDFEPKGFCANPMFMDPRREVPEHFRMLVGSPCQNTGDSISLFCDFSNDKRGGDGRWDIGAFEL